MYALAINGSPRKDGNTRIMLTRALAPLAEAGWETELVDLAGKALRGCIACYKCFENKDMRCAVKNDDLNGLLERIMRADALILGTPTYFTDVTAEMKALLDRTGMVSIANGAALRGKIGAAVVVARRGGATHAYDTINHMFLMSQMIVPGSIYWNIGYGRDKGEVDADAEALANMEHLGRAVDWLGRAIAPHRGAYPLGVRP